MKTRGILILSVLLFLMAFSVPAFAAEAIPIYDWDDLNSVRDGLDGDYILMNDLDRYTTGYAIHIELNPGGWEPIGEFVPADIDGLRLGEWDADASSLPFTGTFNGNGFTISDLIIERPDGFGMGLFGYIRNAEISNLRILNADIVGYRHTGILAGYTWTSTMTDIDTGGALFTRHNGGGLAGTVRENSFVQSCSSTAEIEGDNDSGSLRTGGLIGALHTSTVQDSSTDSIVIGDNYDAGGLIGSAYGTFEGDIKNQSDLYNIELYTDASYILRCHTDGTVYGNGAVGGLIGSTNQASVIEECYTTGNVIATGREVGGLIGNTNYFTQVRRSYTMGNVTGNGSWVGGLVGIVCNYSVIEESFAMGNVTNASILSGGLVGHLSTGAEIHDSYAFGNIIGMGGGVGGLVGSVEGLLLNNKNDDSDDVFLGATILRSYSTGSPAGPYSIGGLIGDIRQGTVTDSYWDIETSGTEDSPRGTGLTSEAMQQEGSFSGWDFGTVWGIEAGSYPYLLWQGNDNIPYLPDLIAVNDNVEVQEDSVVNLIDVFSNDIGVGLQLDDVTAAAHGIVEVSGNAVSYTPDPDFYGFDSFEYTVSDGSSNSDTAAVFIRVNNYVAEDDATTVNKNSSENVIDVLSNDTYSNSNDVYEITSVTDSDNGVIAFNPNEVIYTPDFGFYGDDSFTYTITDTSNDQITYTATVLVTVTNVNNDPIAINDTPTVDQDSTGNVIDVLANDSDPDGDPLTIISVTDPAHGIASIVGNTVSYTPDAGFSGEDSFTYTISDGEGGSDTATVTVTVTEVVVNSSPDAVNDSETVDQDSTGNVIDVLANDSDSDGDSLTVVSVTDPAHGTASIDTNKVSYTPDAGYYGADSFSYTISDGEGGSDTATVTVTVTEVVVNSSPDAVNDSETVDQDSTGNVIDVLANDSDSDGDSLTVVSVTDPAHGTASIDTNKVSYTPDAGYYGADSFSYTISDGEGGSDTATVTVTVTEVVVNSSPDAVSDSKTVDEDSSGNVIDVLANDSDPDGDPMTIISVTDPAHGTASIVGNTVSYTPGANYYGTDSFSYTISDGEGGSDTATVTITVRRQSSGGGSSSGSSVTSTPEIVVSTDSTLQTITSSTEIKASKINGTAEVDITSEVIEALLKNAEDTEETDKEEIVEVTVALDGIVKGIEFSIGSSDLKKLADAIEPSFKLSSPFISMTFDHEALNAIDDFNAQGEIVITAREVEVDELSISERSLVQNRPVYDLDVMKGITRISSFGEGQITVAIPYEIESGEDPDAIVVFYLSDQGELQMVRGYYDAGLKSVVFTTDHFSEFVIGHNFTSFVDVPEQAWYKNAVDFIAARGISSGTGNGKFEPEANLTRADFVVLMVNTYADALVKLSGDPQLGNFDDAGNTYYTDELLAAKRLGLIKGTGNNRFEPELEITRQEMMVMMHNLLKAIGEVPSPIMDKQISSFEDAAHVAQWAMDAVKIFINSGDVVGYMNNIHPENYMTRAEIAQIIRNLLNK